MATRRIVILGGGFGGIDAALEAAAAARNVKAVVTGTARRPFRFSTMRPFATIGRRDGGAEVLGLRFSGFAAWRLRRTVYLSKLPGLVKKVRVATSWSLDLLIAREIEHLVTLRDVERIGTLSVALRSLREGRT